MPCAFGQIHGARGEARREDGSDDDIRAEHKLVVEGVCVSVIGIMPDQRAHDGRAGLRGLVKEVVERGQQLIAQADVAAADGFDLRLRVIREGFLEAFAKSGLILPP